MTKKDILTSRGIVSYWINKTNSDRSIVFIHGLTSDHSLFSRQIDYFENICTIITLDMPLHGESLNYKDFSIYNVARDINSILEKENINNCIIVGQSAGGYVAQSFIDLYPEKVEGFIGIGTSPLGKENYKSTDLFLIKHYKDYARLYPYSYYCKVSSKAATNTKEGRENFLKSLVNLGKNGMLKATSEVYNDFINTKSISINCPVILACGENDKVGYVKKYNSTWSKEKGYPLVIIPNSGHNANYDNSEFFNKILLDFINSI